ncbi:MAG TPA: hypothetical protein VEC96_06325 [Anaerolineae bacterium]|nr:hypothetical protein [Anaerolineae bacterium]
MQKRKLVFLAFLLIVVMALLALPAQAAEGLKATLAASQTELTVGDPVQLTLAVTHPAGSQVIIPKLDQQWGQFEVQSQSPVTTVANPDGSQTTTQTITVTLFDLGSFETPALPLTISTGQGQVTEETVPPVSLTVTPTRAQDDTALKDIRPQADLKVPSQWPLLAAALLAVLAVAGGGWWLYRRWRGQPLFGAGANRPAYQVAFAELARIAALRLPDQGQFKEHYTLVTDCLRTYLEQQFKLHVFERTTFELKTILRGSALSPDQTRQFLDLFSDSDLVKFAKITPELDEAYILLERAHHLVEITRPAPEASKDEKFQRAFGPKQAHQTAEVSQ